MSAIKKCLIILIINAILLAAAIVCWRLNDVKTNSNNVIIVIPPSTDGDAELKEFTAVRFEDMTVIYDGLEHEIVLSGALPNGTVVEYASNTGVETGVYNATATIKKEGYKTLTLTATLTINKATLTDIIFSDKTVTANGKVQYITVEGELPKGTSIKYVDNSATEAGVYNAIAVISNPNYETLTLRATLTIKNVAQSAKDF